MDLVLQSNADRRSPLIPLIQIPHIHLVRYFDKLVAPAVGYFHRILN